MRHRVVWRGLASALSALAAVLLVQPATVLACSVCYGDPESPMVKGAVWGVWALLGVVGIVQIGFAVFFFVYLPRRAKQLEMAKE